MGVSVGTTTSADMQLQPKFRIQLEDQNKGTLGLAFSLTGKREGFISAWGKKSGKPPTLLIELKCECCGPKCGLISVLYRKFWEWQMCIKPKSQIVLSVLSEHRLRPDTPCTCGTEAALYTSCLEWMMATVLAGRTREKKHPVVLSSGPGSNPLSLYKYSHGFKQKWRKKRLVQVQILLHAGLMICVASVNSLQNEVYKKYHFPYFL